MGASPLIVQHLRVHAVLLWVILIELSLGRQLEGGPERLIPANHFGHVNVADRAVERGGLKAFVLGNLDVGYRHLPFPLHSTLMISLSPAIDIQVVHYEVWAFTDLIAVLPHNRVLQLLSAAGISLLSAHNHRKGLGLPTQAFIWLEGLRLV